MNATKVDRPGAGPRAGYRHGLAIAIMTVLLVAGGGCKVTPTHQKLENTVHAPEDVAATDQQIRIRMRALVEPLSGMIVESADRIMAATTNRLVRREALVWKLEAVPALREALFRPNAFVAAMDTWVLTIQMGNYFESGPGRAALGDAAPIAVTTCQALAAEIERVAASLMKSGDVSDAREFARKWAGEHPIQHSIASRESTLSRVTERELQDTFSTQEVAGNVVVTLDDLSRRLDIFSAQLLDQARWQAELFAMDQTVSLGVDKAMPLAENAARSVDRSVAILERLAPTLENSLTVVTQAPSLLTAELSRMTNFVQEQRLAALTQLANERVAAVRDLTDTVEAERLAFVAEMDRISLKAVDHAFWRAAQLLVAAGLVAFIAMALLWVRVRRPLGNPTNQSQ